MIEWEDRSSPHAGDVSLRGSVDGEMLYRIDNYYRSWNEGDRNIFTVFQDFRIQIEFNNVEDAKHWCEMHYATGA